MRREIGTDSDSEGKVLRISRKFAAAKNFFAVDLCMTYYQKTKDYEMIESHLVA
jgi:hypothetical protein